MMMRWIKLAMSAIFLLVAPLAFAATYKWVDEKGIVHYGDRAPTQYGNTLDVRTISKFGVPSARQAQANVVEQDPEKQKAQAKRQLEQARQDNALLATYASEQEIEYARERELNRRQEIMATASGGLAKSNSPEDKRKLASLLAKGQKEVDAINAKFDAYQARFRELKSPPKVAQSADTKRHVPAQ
jgi:hypothetical protein